MLSVMSRATEITQMNIFEPKIDELVRADHAYRKLLNLLDFTELCKGLKDVRAGGGRAGYDLEKGFAAMLLQWMEDLSDRQMERFLQENTAAKFFCGFTLTQKTPDHSYFGRLRNAIGTSRLSKLFRKVDKALRKQGVVTEIFTFVDASSMISKLTTWEERDKAIKEGEEKLNNANINNYSADKQAKFGCKGKNKFWYGYKRHVAVDMKQGIITKVAVTPANEPDSKGLELVCPNGGMVVADKAFCGAEAQKTIEKNGCHSGAIMTKNMKNKNPDKDKFLSSLRSPYESTFSQMQKRCRYKGVVKNQFQAFMESLAFNFKRLITINSPPIFA
jgi:IS5 family transposase